MASILHQTVGTKNQNVIPVGKRDTFPACAEAKERLAAIQSHLRARTRRSVINLSKVSGQKVDPFMVSVLVDGKALEMEVDTGASVSLIRERTLKTHWRKEDKRPTRKRAAVKLSLYTGEAIKVIRAIDVAGHQDQREKLRLIVVAGRVCNLPCIMKIEYF